MMQYLFQNMNFRGDAKSYQDLLRSIAAEEMGHVELVANTINVLLEGASTPSKQPEELPLSVALESPNIHHFLVAGQSSRPVDAAGNPWSATATVSYLIVRDLTHEKLFAKALETLGVQWNKALPIPRIDTSGMKEVKELERKNLHNQMWTFTDNNKNETSGLADIFKGSSPFDDGGELEVIDGHPEGANIPFMPDAPQEFASGLDTDLRKLAQQVRNVERRTKTTTTKERR
jgi:Mn-containing catalase